MIIAIIIAVLIFGYSIYQTRQYNKLEDKYDLLKLEHEDLKKLNKEISDLHYKEISRSENRLKLYELSQKTVNELTYNLSLFKTPIVIEPVITVDDATEVIKPKRGRKAKV